MRKLYGLLLVVAAIFIAWMTINNSDVTSSIKERNYVKNDLLVNVDWLKENLHKKNILVLDARGEEPYKEGHIEGAISTSWQTFSNMKAAKGEGFTTLLKPEELSKKFQEFGINNKKTIIVYANPNAWGEDGRIVWMLRMAGLSNTKILDGGWPAWQRSNGKTSTKKTSPTPSKILVKQMNNNMLISTEEIMLKRKEIAIIDSRSTLEWYGTTSYGESRGGHIKDALHIEWSDLLNENGTIKSQVEIEAIMGKEGLKKDDTLVLYCTAGIRSAHMTLILQMAGYKNAKNYAASIYEWSARSELPMEK